MRKIAITMFVAAFIFATLAPMAVLAQQEDAAHRAVGGTMKTIGEATKGTTETAASPIRAFWRWITKMKRFPWGDFEFTGYYFVFRNNFRYSELVVRDSSAKKCFTLKRDDIVDFDDFIETLKRFNPDTRVESLEDDLKERGIVNFFLK